VPLHKRFGELLRRERRQLFWAAITAALVSSADVIFLQRKLVALVIALVGGLAHGCYGMLDVPKNLH
jgi:hypothetical protein